MKQRKQIGVDLMGGDIEPQVILDAILLAQKALPECHFVLFATPEFAMQHEPLLQAKEVLSFVPSPQVISMKDRPVHAVKAKPNSSLVLGIKALKEKKIDAFVSCGNTGAILAAASLNLPHLPTITRPGLLARLPSLHGSINVLDVGANVTCKALELVQFAHFASLYQSLRSTIERPKVALLNIGTEKEKGTRELKEAYRLLAAEKDAPFEFVGNVEGKDVFTAGIDVLITSGFAGNIFLKTAEGTALFVLAAAEKKLALSPDILHKLKEELSDEASRGALVAGVDGLVIKCHGQSSVRAIFNAILGAHELAQSRIIEKLRSRLTRSSSRSIVLT